MVVAEGLVVADWWPSSSSSRNASRLRQVGSWRRYVIMDIGAGCSDKIASSESSKNLTTRR